MVVYPLMFDPILQPRIWGGRALERLYGRALPAGEKIGESWDISDLPEGVSVVSNGPGAGHSLHDVVTRWADRLLGAAPLAEGRFPLMVKFLDAHDVLSVQVHPDEGACPRMGGIARAKHEAWYIVEARDDAVIYAGLEPGVTREEFLAAVADGSVERMLRRVPVCEGECYYLPGGTVHAMGAGVVAAEVQTPSATTYRVFDWNRTDGNGKPRPLHVEQAVMCIHFGQAGPVQQPRRHEADAWTMTTRLVACPQFVIDKVRAVQGFERKLSGGMMLAWIVLAGRGRLETEGLPEPIRFKAGQSLVIPAEPNETVLTIESDCQWLQVSVPV
jgi:mannose-6-phosphate isomerase